MRYVLDSCVALKWVLPEVDSDKAVSLRDDFRNAIHEFIAPDSFTLECANSLTKKERQRLILDARSLWDVILVDAPRFFPIHPLMDRALDICAQTRHNVHDCLFVALAEIEGCDMITADEKLINNLQAQFPFIVPLSSF